MDTKLKTGKPISSQAREIVYNVYLYFIIEANAFKKEEQGYFHKVHQRVADATGVSKRTLARILKEKDGPSTSFSTPKKGRPKSKFRLKLDDFDYCVIRNMVYDFHLRFKEHPTIKSLRAKLIEAINFKGCADTLRKILHDMGFRFYKIGNNRKLLMEKHEIRLKRITYLSEIKKLRAEGRNIVYMDESYVHTSHTKGKYWVDKNKQGVKKPIAKGERIIIVHAGNEKGFVPNALMLHKCIDADGDYHKEMNADRYEHWLRTQLIPNLPNNSVLVIDNAPYHNKLVEKPPNSNSRKAVMIAWLIKHNISYDAALTRPELYEIIKPHKERFTEFAIDRILKEHGHSVLRLPPYHPDFNPIETIWSQIKGYVAKKNIEMNVTTVKQLLVEKIDMIGPENWKKLCDHSIKCEDQFRTDENAFDRHTDNLIINVGSDSDSEMSEGGSFSDISGVESLSDD